MAVPLTCTVQAPHCAIPQPNFVPVKPITSRSTQRSGVSDSMLVCRDAPLTSIVITVALSPPWRTALCARDCGRRSRFRFHFAVHLGGVGEGGPNENTHAG